MYTKEHTHLIGICLRAQAVADAIGEQFEFQEKPKKAELLHLLQSNKIVHITDDTQMTMFGIEAMISGGPSAVILHYLMWDMTQQSTFPINAISSPLLIDQRKMWQIRAPGNTCLNSLRKLRNADPVVNNSNGCGTVMKALPFLFEDTSDLLVDISFETHKGPQIKPTAIKQWVIANKLLMKQKLNMYEGLPLSVIFGDGGWQAEPCLDIAIWAFENCNGDFNKMLELAILHSGDSDSVAATAGVLYGLFYETYPTELYDRVFEKDVIELLLKRVEQSTH